MRKEQQQLIEIKTCFWGIIGRQLVAPHVVCVALFLGGKEEEHGGKHSSESTAAGIYDLIYDIYGHRYDLDVASFGYAWICVILTQSSTDCL